MFSICNKKQCIYVRNISNKTSAIRMVAECKVLSTVPRELLSDNRCYM